MIIAPSILSADFAKLGDELSAVTKAGADWIHVDVMDGQFVPNITLGPPVIKSLRPHTSLPFDVHLMIEQPERHVAAFAAAGANLITVHQEVSPHLHRTLTQIREAGCRPGVSINPSTPAETLEYVLPLCDLVLVMTVNPGFGGQAFIPQCVEKVRRLRALADKLQPSLHIEVDGGINAETARDMARAGADAFVAGSAVFGKGGEGEEAYRARIGSIRAAVTQ